MTDYLNFDKVVIQPIQHKEFDTINIKADILRLDLIHPIVSGNKWFKLQYYLQEAKIKNCTTIITFGGAYSNHIVAAAFACTQAGLSSIGVIRGERSKQLSPTLQTAISYGMQLEFASREDYRKKYIPSSYNKTDFYIVDEGGYGILGTKGAEQILGFVPDLKHYTDIFCAVGTGTMMAGLINSSLIHQHVHGISAMKKNFSLENAVKKLLNSESQHKRFTIHHDYHFGGYGKHPAELLSFMKDLYQSTNIPTDIVYTGKLVFGVIDLVTNRVSASDSCLLIIHSGGLQGNLSLPDIRLFD